MNWIFALATAMVLASSSPARAGETVKGQYSNGNGTLAYQLYIPENKAASMPVFVVLHGCFMSGDQMASGTQLNAWAEKRGFYVLYPDQTYANNAWKCWNWFKPENLRRGREGELSLIAGATKDILSKYPGADAQRVFVSGLSAGGGMASNLAACYSDVFAGVMVHSGLEFAAARSEAEAHQVTKNAPSHDVKGTAEEAYRCSPARSSAIPVVVVHGTSDPYVSPKNADRVIEQFSHLNQLILKGGKVSLAESRMEQDGFKFSAAVKDYSIGGKPTMREVLVESMAHGWSGGQSTAPYMEPRGVDASKIMVDFFLGTD